VDAGRHWDPQHVGIANIRERARRRSESGKHLVGDREALGVCALEPGAPVRCFFDQALESPVESDGFGVRFGELEALLRIASLVVQRLRITPAILLESLTGSS
jgi:hypothetical protein